MSCAPHVPFAGRRSARLGAIAAAALGLTASMLGGVAHADIPGAGGGSTPAAIAGAPEYYGSSISRPDSGAGPANSR
jgi:hypothetical protein